MVEDRQHAVVDDRGVEYSLDGKKLLCAYGLSGDYIIRDGVEMICNDAFSRCGLLCSLTLPSGVSRIGAWAFSGCKSLAVLTLPSGLTSIGGSAFEGCSSLENLTLPDSVTHIGRGAFGECSLRKDVKDDITERFGEEVL